MNHDLSSETRALLGLQQCVIARWQATGVGLDISVIDARLRQKRWQTLYRGVYAAFTGSPSRSAVLWAALLRAGPGAVLSHYTAAELDQLADQPAVAIHVTVSSSRRIAIRSAESGPGLPPIAVHHSARLCAARHPSRTPPRTRIVETTLDLTQAAPDVHRALMWLVNACSRRLTTPDHLLIGMQDRPKLKWRREMTGALSDIGEGIHSALEWRYVHRVERPHGLPRADRQAPSRTARGQNRYFDNYYPAFGVAVEVDGNVSHPAEARWRDIHRDNGSAALGILTLRYSWADIVRDPCRVGAEVARVLRSRGWQGEIRACGPDCRSRLS